LPQAIEAYREAVRLDPENLDHARGLATTLERNREDDAAEAAWRRALELTGDDRAARREARERIVAIWNRTRQMPQRLAELERRFAGSPPDAEAGRFLAELHRRRGPQHLADAERVLQRIIEIEPGDIESLLALERAYASAGDLAAAIETLGRLVEADARRAPTYLQRMAEHSLALYRDEDAVRYAERAVEHTPDDAEAHRRLGDLYRARQDGERAIASYRRAITIDERMFPTYLELAELHLARGEQTDADRLFRRVVRGSPDDDLVGRAARASIQIHLGAGRRRPERGLPLALHHPAPDLRRVAVGLDNGRTARADRAPRRPDAARARTSSDRSAAARSSRCSRRCRRSRSAGWRSTSSAISAT
jgi:tetratricopeptide (TPR) repeat protein